MEKQEIPYTVGAKNQEYYARSSQFYSSLFDSRTLRPLFENSSISFLFNLYIKNIKSPKSDRSVRPVCEAGP